MKSTGNIKGIVKDVLSRKILLTVSIDTEPIEELSKLQGLEHLDIEITKHVQRRSINANAYFHKLCGEIAKVLNVPMARVKNDMIKRYGQPMMLDDGNIVYYKTNAPVEYTQDLEEVHLVAVRFNEDGTTMYRMMRGTHTYNTDEMKQIIDGVVADAKDLGIETETPDTINHMISVWKTSDTP